jgi:hypothetical protein
LVRKVVAIMMAAVYLAACGAPSSNSGSNVTRAATMAQPDAVDVAPGATHPQAASDSGSHPAGPIDHSVNPAAQKPVVRPGASPPTAEPDETTPGLRCGTSINGPGKPKVMCAPQ